MSPLLSVARSWKSSRILTTTNLRRHLPVTIYTGIRPRQRNELGKPRTCLIFLVLMLLLQRHPHAKTSTPTSLQRLGKRRPSLISIDELGQHIDGQCAALDNDNSQGHLEGFANSMSHSRLATAFPGILAATPATEYQAHSNTVDTINEFYPIDRTRPRGLGDANF
ncbi:hypothetical protein HDK90DRAFT_306423 [Phyllosticta capitalensis]|uniref:Uncharacterized protein n=1 Tax=Phyllosticta capitalensis TaxID=121624 RepID=A0ABR1YKQ8_9PEZI